MAGRILMLLTGLRSIVRPDLAVDLGTATTRVSPASGAFVFAMPSKVGGESVLDAGVIVDRERAVELLRPMLQTATRFGVTRPRVVACAPTDANQEERASVTEAVRRSGASAVTVVPEPLAAAVGSGIDVSSRYSRMVVDIGHGVTDCAVIRSGQIVTSSALRVACAELERALIRYALESHGITLSSEVARALVSRVSFDPAIPATGTIELGGAGLRVLVPADEIVAALAPVHGTIVGSISSFLRGLPARTGVEIIESGIDLTGGGALLRGMAESIAAATRIEVRTVSDALGAVVRGARKMIPTVAASHEWS